MTVVLDTCAIVWAVSEPERLPVRAAALLEAADTEACVSAIGCAEIACAAERGRIELDRQYPDYGHGGDPGDADRFAAVARAMTAHARSRVAALLRRKPPARRG